MKTNTVLGAGLVLGAMVAAGCFSTKTVVLGDGGGTGTGGEAGASGGGGATGTGGGGVGTGGGVVVGTGGGVPGTGGGVVGTGGGVPGTGGGGGGTGGGVAGTGGSGVGTGIIPTCGNGTVDSGEACDAGPQNGLFFGDGSGCSKHCSREPSCRDGTMTVACAVVCGNGSVELGEACDDGNLLAGDGCSPTCTLEAGFDCTSQTRPDVVPCADGAGGAQCMRLPVVYRDFKSEKENGGHPDFFYFGASVTPAVSISNPTGSSHATVSWNRRYCISNSSGPAMQYEASGRCWDLASAALDPKGKPVFNSARTGGNLCDCLFTDWSHDTNGGHVPGYVDASNSPLSGIPYVAGTNGHPLYRGKAPAVTSATSFSQWFVDSGYTDNKHTAGVLELSSPSNNGQYRFASSPHNVYGGYFPLDPPGNNFPLTTGSMSGPGAIRVVGTEPLLCNIWPYWYSSSVFGAGNSCRGDQYLFPPSIMVLGGMWVTAMQGWFHNFWFTTEIRYLFVHSGSFELQFYGDDDTFVFINGTLVLDLGGIHSPIPGQVKVTADGMASIVEGGSINPSTGTINPCPSVDPYSMLTTNATCPAGTCDCRLRTLALGLTTGMTYELAIFHADRHPTGSDYQLTMSGFTTNRTICTRR